jgi:hypothetical protein
MHSFVSYKHRTGRLYKVQNGPVYSSFSYEVKYILN